MNELLISNSFFCVALTLVVFSLASMLQQKTKLTILNPVLVSAAVIILSQFLLDIPNETYQAGCSLLTYLLTPATICLSISLFEQYKKLKGNLLCIFAGIMAGTVCCMGSVYLLCSIMGLDRVLLASLLPKGVTTAIGAALSEELGGIAAISSAVIILSGIVGNMIGPALFRWLKIDDEIAQGVALGTAAHVIGTARATQIGQLAAAVSSLSLTIAGIITAIFLSFLAQYL